MTPVQRSRHTALFAASAVAALAVAACSGGGSATAASPPARATTATHPTSTVAPVDWTMYHRDPAHSGAAYGMPAVTKLARVAQIKLDAAVYASPIVVNDLIIVGTENDTLYAFDRNYRQVWKTSLGAPSPQSERPCGDITPLGITGTPIYSPSTKLAYVVAQHGGTVRHEVVAFSPTTGRVAWRKSVDLPGADPTVMQQRGALSGSHGYLQVPFGALAGDCGNYKGRVVYLPLNGTGSPKAFDASPKKQGGVWNPAGGTIDAQGYGLFVSANGSSFPGDAYDHTNSVNKITPGTGRLVDSFAPTDWAQNNQADVGLGSNGVALVGTKYAVLGGKSGPVYVLNQAKLGGIGGQVSTQTVCKVFGGSAVLNDTVFLPCSDTGNKAIRISSTGQIQQLWTAPSNVHGTPVVGGGAVFSLDQSGGTLYALSYAGGKTLHTVSVGPTSRFASPAVTGRDVLVPTLAGLTVVRTS